MSRFFNRTPNTRSTFDHPINSLLFPPGKSAPEFIAARWHDDLGLSEIVSHLAKDRTHARFAQGILGTLHTDEAVIRWRQAVFADFVQNPALLDQLETLLPRLADLRQDNSLLGRRQRGILLRTSERLAELEIYTDIVTALHQALQSATLHSEALSSLHATLTRIISDPNFIYLRDNLPELRKPLQKISSLTIGINLDVEMRPESAVLMSINDFHIQEQFSFLDRILGASTEGSVDKGIAQLHFVPRDADLRPFAPLFQDLDRLMTQVAEPVEQILKQYARTSSAPLINLEVEMAFFVSAARLMHSLVERGIACCLPEILPAVDRRIDIRHLVNLNLTLKNEPIIVPNDFEFGEDGHIAILTGPNSGGKTTYIQSLGLAVMMFQAGLFIPAEAAYISPADMILTHYPALETRQQGRLAEESERLREVFQQATAGSLVLLNETFASTTSQEAAYLAQDVLSGLRAVGVRGVYATHLTELVEKISEIEAGIAGSSRLFSLVAGIEFDAEMNGKPTYRITRGEPLGRSYAREIARRYGISLEQILAMREQRK